MKPMSEAAKGMAKAIRHMNEYGWCKGLDEGPNGEVCIGTALSRSGTPFQIGTETPEKTALYKAMRKLPVREMAHYRNAIPAFNDHPDTTYADVKQVMERALVLLIQEESAEAMLELVE